MWQRRESSDDKEGRRGGRFETPLRRARSMMVVALEASSLGVG